MKDIGRILVASLFIISGLTSVYNFGGYVNAVKSKNIPFPTIIAALALVLKIFGGIIIAFSNNINYIRYAKIGLIVFTILTIILYHNAFVDRSQQSDMLKNLSVIGGLILA